MKITNKIILKKIIPSLPIIILYFLVLTGFDLSFFFYDINFSFNFVYLIIFFFVLKNPENLSYALIFLAGIINDIVQNFPIGISSIDYLLLCTIAVFIRSRIIIPSLLYVMILFFIAILIVSSVNYTILVMIFGVPIKYGALISNLILTCLMYPILSKMMSNKIFLTIRSEDV